MPEVPCSGLTAADTHVMYSTCSINQPTPGSADGPPRIVAILPLSSLCNTAGVRDALLAAHPDVATVAQEVRERGTRRRGFVVSVVDDGSQSPLSLVLMYENVQGGALTAAFKGLKQRFTFLLPRFGLMEALEAAKVRPCAFCFSFLLPQRPPFRPRPLPLDCTTQHNRWRIW